jgi:hypothetical protein
MKKIALGRSQKVPFEPSWHAKSRELIRVAAHRSENMLKTKYPTIYRVSH